MKIIIAIVITLYVNQPPVLCWIAVMAASVCRAFPIRYCANGLYWLYCHWIRKCTRQFCSSDTANDVSSAKTASFPAPTERNTALIAR